MKLKLLKLHSLLRLVTDLKFALLVFVSIAFFSALGSILEQEESIEFYQEKYSETHPIYGFLTWKIIEVFGLNHIYTTTWFFSLLFLLAVCLFSCTLTRQFPTFFSSTQPLFKKQIPSFVSLSFYIRLKSLPYLQEVLLSKINTLQFALFQKKNFIYGYKGLIGKISPILVHFSLLLLLFGSSWGAFENFKAQEVLAKGEIFHIQNSLRVGYFTTFPTFPVRVNDFWVEYKDNKVSQFYSNVSILNNVSQELKQQTISVNHPFKFQKIDIYQSDWNLLGIRILRAKEDKNQEILQLPLFPLQEGKKLWVTWIPDETKIPVTPARLKESNPENSYSLILDQLQNILFVYKGNQIENFLSVNDAFRGNNEFRIVEILPSTGLLIKYDPSIDIIYLGFAALMLTTLFSFLPYTQLWLMRPILIPSIRTKSEAMLGPSVQSNYTYSKEGQTNNQLAIGGATNRGKLTLELFLENLTRWAEQYSLQKTKKKVFHRGYFFTLKIKKKN